MKGGSAMVLLPIRLVTGWMFFSAFHRRVVLDAAKLTPDAPGYVGEKFNQFMPGAILGVGDLIGALLDRPGALHAFLWTFTIVEALAGLALLLGLGTRLAALGTLLLSAGILAGAGWLGPTCLDEWQIGSLGIAGGATVMLGGAGPFSLDAWLARRWPHLADTRWFRLLADPEPRPARPLVGALAAISIGATLATNQVFHGGLWGTLHNDSVRPRVDVLGAQLAADGRLAVTIERAVGPETYGAFLVNLWVHGEDGAPVLHHSAASLAALPPSQIENRWLVKVRPGPHGLVVPLGAQARVTLPTATATRPITAGSYRIELEDVSGARWSQVVVLGEAPSGRPQVARGAGLRGAQEGPPGT